MMQQLVYSASISSNNMKKMDPAEFKDRNNWDSKKAPILPAGKKM